MIELKRLTSEDREQFILDNQEVFNYGAMQEFGMRDDHFEEEGQIISRETIEKSIDGGEAYRIMKDGQPVGGVIVKVDGEHGDLDILFVSPDIHSRGIGYAAWCAIRGKFDNAVKELRDSIAQGGEEFRSDGAILLGSLKEIAEDAGIDMKENEAISDAYHTVKESFEEGIENFKSDMTITKESVEEVASERKEEKDSKKAEKKEAFLETVESVKESIEEGKEAFISDMNITKESMEEIAADRNEAKAEKKAEKRERFDEKVDELKKSLE